LAVQGAKPPKQEARHFGLSCAKIAKMRAKARSGSHSLRPLGAFAVGLAFALSLLVGCNAAPTLPLPPPVASIEAPNAQGLVLLVGDAPKRSYVSAFNPRTEAGVITRADLNGKFSLEIEAASGDYLTLWVELEGEVGERVDIRVPEER
jgi:hypothetical protein